MSERPTSATIKVKGVARQVQALPTHLIKLDPVVQRFLRVSATLDALRATELVNSFNTLEALASYTETLQAEIDRLERKGPLAQQDGDISG